MTGIGARLFAEAFEREIDETLEANPDVSHWSVAGRGKLKTNPNGEDQKWWRANGPGMVDNWITWRRRVAWRVWQPEGQGGPPAIEMPMEFVTPKGRPIKGFVDRVFVTPSGDLVIVDLKSGKRTPESQLQLAFYRYEIYNTLGVDIKFGAYWMARTGEMQGPYNLERLTPRLFATWMDRFDKAIDHEIFIPNISFKCPACSHRDYCVAFGGSKSHLDPDSHIEEEAA